MYQGFDGHNDFEIAFKLLAGCTQIFYLSDQIALELIDKTTKPLIFFFDIGEALQSYSIGEELLSVELGKAESNPHHALDILDFFQVSRTV